MACTSRNILAASALKVDSFSRAFSPGLKARLPLTPGVISIHSDRAPTRERSPVKVEIMTKPTRYRRPPIHMIDSEADVLGELALAAAERSPQVSAMLLEEMSASFG